MKNVTPYTANMQPQTMSSREIAELTGKQHQHVKRDCETMFDELQLDASSFGRIYLDSRNRQQTEYLLPKELVETLITGYSIKLRHAVIQRLHELEQQVATGQVAVADLSKLEVLQMALESEQQKVALQQKVEELEPKAQALDALANSTGLETIDQASHSIGLKPRKELRPWMEEHGWIYRDKEGAWRAYSQRVQSGHLKERDRTYTKKDGTQGHTVTVYVCPKGKTLLTTNLSKEGWLMGKSA